MRGIRDVDDDVNLSGVAIHRGSQMHVTAAEVPVTMCSEATGLVLAQPNRMNRILQAPDHDAFVPGFLWIRIPAGLRSLERRNHLPVGDIQLAGARVRGAGNPVEDRWPGRVGDVK